MINRTPDLLVRQRTQTINALRAHLAEQGIVAPTDPPMSDISPQSSTATTAARCPQQ